MSLTAGQVAERLGGALEGDAGAVISNLAGLAEAQPGDLAAVLNAGDPALAADTRASAVLVPRTWQGLCPAVLIRVDQPDQALAAAAEWFAPPVPPPPRGVHPTAIIHPDARLGSDVSVGPFCTVAARVEIGARTVLDAGCHLGYAARIGADSRLYPNVGIREYCRVGDRAILHNGVVIGCDGFGYTVTPDGVRQKIPQIGVVEIGDDVEIGANTTIDRGRYGRTAIGRGVKIDNLVQIAHNVVIGAHAIIVAQAGVASAATIGPCVIVAGQAGVAGRLTVGEGAIIGARAGVLANVPAHAYVSGFPALPHEQSLRLQALVRELPALRARLEELEARLRRPAS